MLHDFELPSESFSTPFLDFTTHSRIIKDHIDKLVNIKDHELKLQCTIKTLQIFNLLTKPPQKQRQQRSVQKSSNIFEISTHAFDPTLQTSQKAYYHYLRGRILNLFDYHSSTEYALVRAVKLDPSLILAWNELGELNFKKKDYKTAQKCFEWALVIVFFPHSESSRLPVTH
jgi:tetratricopeptide (TPR) repeat protein